MKKATKGVSPAPLRPAFFLAGSIWEIGRVAPPCKKKVPRRAIFLAAVARAAAVAVEKCRHAGA
jgi:hypothetical protein